MSITPRRAYVLGYLQKCAELDKQAGAADLSDDAFDRSLRDAFKSQRGRTLPEMKSDLANIISKQTGASLEHVQQAMAEHPGNQVKFFNRLQQLTRGVR